MSTQPGSTNTHSIRNFWISVKFCQEMQHIRKSKKMEFASMEIPQFHPCFLVSLA